MAKPNCLLIGAPKAATTSIATMLSQHPQVCVSKGKETHFFSYDSIYARGLDWYEPHFAHGRDKPAIIDASGSYSRLAAFPRTVERIVRHVPDAKIIYSVRHPLDRIESAYIEWMASPGADQNFPSVNEAVRNNPELIDSSSYWRQISAYRRHFPDDRIKIVFFDQYTANPHAVLAELFGFLGVSTEVRIPKASVPILTRASRVRAMREMGNNTPISTVWNLQTRQWAIDQLADDVGEFLRWCGKPADYWRLNAKDKTTG